MKKGLTPKQGHGYEPLGTRHADGHQFATPLKKGTGLTCICLPHPQHGEAQLIGKIVGGVLHVEDVIDGSGHSELAMTGKKPALKPVPLSYFTEQFPGATQKPF